LIFSRSALTGAP